MDEEHRGYHAGKYEGVIGYIREQLDYRKNHPVEEKKPQATDLVTPDSEAMTTRKRAASRKDEIDAQTE